MAHVCPDCGMLCYCGGDIDDCEFDGTPEQMSCSHCENKDTERCDDSTYTEKFMTTVNNEDGRARGGSPQPSCSAKLPGHWRQQAKKLRDAADQHPERAILAQNWKAMAATYEECADDFERTASYAGPGSSDWGAGGL